MAMAPSTYYTQSFVSAISTSTGKAAPSPSLNGETNFKVIIEGMSNNHYKYEIYNALDDEDYARRIDYGYGKNPKHAEKKARQHIDRILAPYQPKPTAANFVPSIVKRVI